ncbi:MAG: hypothetical protein AMJ79_05855 [Phycisphaerae bacterium SM23_30]|nr:MAG: hypothetical protein AMJ79_05855 [Phycisphaerae bacterium SM23_30]
MKLRDKMDEATNLRLEFLENMDYASYENSNNIDIVGGFESDNRVQNPKWRLLKKRSNGN